jgi:hypothetical protein
MQTRGLAGVWGVDNDEQGPREVAHELGGHREPEHVHATARARARIRERED